MHSVNQLSGFGARRSEETTISVELTDESLLIGNMIGSGGLVAARDGNLIQTSGACARGTNLHDPFIGVDWGSGKNRTVTRVVITSSSNFGFSEAGNENITLTIRGSNSAPASRTEGTSIGSLVSFLDSNSLLTKIFEEADLLTNNGYRYHWLDILADVDTGQHTHIGEIQIYGFDS